MQGFESPKIMTNCMIILTTQWVVLELKWSEDSVMMIQLNDIDSEKLIKRLGFLKWEMQSKSVEKGRIDKRSNSRAGNDMLESRREIDSARLKIAQISIETSQRVHSRAWNLYKR